jgi:putative transposon-encoded protein
MKAKYIKLRPAQQSLIKETLNDSLLEVLKITQNSGIMSNEVDNMFRCKKVYKFNNGEKVYIPKIVPEGHNLYSFLAHLLTDIDLNEPVQRKSIECIFTSVELIKKALLADWKESNLALLHRLLEVNSLENVLLRKEIASV